MSDTKFDEQQMKDFDAYEKVRASGKYNMFDPKAAVAADLPEERYLIVLKNYTAMARQKDGIKKR